MRRSAALSSLHFAVRWLRSHWEEEQLVRPMEKGGEPGEAAALRGLKSPQGGIRLGRDLNGWDRLGSCSTFLCHFDLELWPRAVGAVHQLRMIHAVEKR